MRNKQLVFCCSRVGTAVDNGAQPHAPKADSRMCAIQVARFAVIAHVALFIFALVGYFLTVVLPWFLRVIVPMAGWG